MAPRPYDLESLERAALDYAARYATTQSKLSAFLRRKLRERGWAAEEAPPVAALVARFAANGFVDDASFARNRTESLVRRGYGMRRIETTLRGAGIDCDIIDAERAIVREGAEAAAMAYARRRRLGRFSDKLQDVASNRRALAAMLRAGHDMDVARRVLAADFDDDDLP